MNKTKKWESLEGNQNAAKEKTKTHTLSIRCTAEERKLWEKVCGGTLTGWATSVLNREALKIIAGE